MLEILAYAGCYVAGVMSAAFFVAGFMAHKRLEDTGRLFGETKVPEPFLNTSREALVEQRRAETIDLDAYENEG